MRPVILAAAALGAFFLCTNSVHAQGVLLSGEDFPRVLGEAGVARGDVLNGWRTRDGRAGTCRSLEDLIRVAMEEMSVRHVTLVMRRAGKTLEIETPPGAYTMADAVSFFREFNRAVDPECRVARIKHAEAGVWRSVGPQVAQLGHTYFAMWCFAAASQDLGGGARYRCHPGRGGRPGPFRPGTHGPRGRMLREAGWLRFYHGDHSPAEQDLSHPETS